MWNNTISSTKLKLPTKSLVEEFKLGKARLFQMLRDSVDPLVKSAPTAIITDRKWDAEYAVETVESSLKMNEVISTNWWNRTWSLPSTVVVKKDHKK